MTTEGIFLIMELIGTAAFAISGALLAIKKNMDIFGIVFLGVITALGGGATRDIIIGNNPPAMFVNYLYIVIAIVAAALVFTVARIMRKSYHNNLKNIKQINNIFDAIGLGAFTITGMNVTANMGYGDNVVLMLIMGMITGIGGGILRDLLAGEVPFVFKEKIYAVASLIGGLVYYGVTAAGLSNGISIFIGVVSVFAIRIIATVFYLDLPRVFPGDEVK